ncbi:unnamed protein product [Absidia cylindrospora]
MLGMFEVVIVWGKHSNKPFYPAFILRVAQRRHIHHIHHHNWTSLNSVLVGWWWWRKIQDQQKNIFLCWLWCDGGAIYKINKRGSFFAGYGVKMAQYTISKK